MTKKQYSLLHATMQKIGSTRSGALFFSRIQPQIDRFLLKLTGGKTNLTSLLSGLPVVLLTAKGAKSGLWRTTPLLGIKDPAGTGKIAVIASNYGQGHHPAWYYNLKANPHTICIINGKEQKYVAYQAQGQEYIDTVLPPTITIRLAVEAGVSFGWDRWIGPQGAVISVDQFGASAPVGVVYEKFGLTIEHVITKAKELLG